MKTFIEGLSYYIPERVLTNKELAEVYPAWDVEKAGKKVGISQRYVSGKEETALDMAVKASEALFQEYSISREDVDFVMLCTQSPDYVLPTSACILQNRLGLSTSCGALDYNLGCSGFVYGLSLAKGLVMGGVAQKVLLVTAETYTKHIHTRDKGNRMMFGDAAAAALVSTTGFASIENFCLGTDGSGAENLMVKTGGQRFPDQLPEEFDGDAFVKSPNHLYMNGPEIFNFTLKVVPVVVRGTLERNGIQNDDVDLFVFHQANKLMLNTIRKLCGIDPVKFYYCLENIGNTVSSTIPIALKEAKRDGSIVAGSRVLIAGFGVGYSWGGSLLKYV